MLHTWSLRVQILGVFRRGGCGKRTLIRVLQFFASLLWNLYGLYEGGIVCAYSTNLGVQVLI